MAEDLEKLGCPICKEGIMEPSCIGRTEIWICPVCPAVLFTYYDQQNWMDVGAELGLDQEEQI